MQTPDPWTMELQIYNMCSMGSHSDFCLSCGFAGQDTRFRKDAIGGVLEYKVQCFTATECRYSRFNQNQVYTDCAEEPAVAEMVCMGMLMTKSILVAVCCVPCIAG